MPGEKKSGFHYLGVGCLVIGVLVVVLGVALSAWFYNWANEVKTSMKDPQSRAQRVREILGAERLPEGYNAMVGIKVPMMLETAILTNREADEDDEVPPLGERGLIYLSMRSFGRDREDLDDFFSGREDDPAVLRKHNVQLDLDERVASGRLERDSGPVLWVSHRGEMASGQTHGRHEGLVTLLQIHCPTDNRNRLGIWWGPEPEPPVSEDDSLLPALAGSVADREHVEEFLGNFRFCPAD